MNIVHLTNNSQDRLCGEKGGTAIFMYSDDKGLQDHLEMVTFFPRYQFDQVNTLAGCGNGNRLIACVFQGLKDQSARQVV